MCICTHVCACINYVYTLRTLLNVATNFSVLVAYWIWQVLFLAIFELSVTKKNTIASKKDNLSRGKNLVEIFAAPNFGENRGGR